MKNKSVKILDEILLTSVLIIVIIRFFVEKYGDKESAYFLSWFPFALALGLILNRLMYKMYPKWFVNKPTLEEIDERQFGKNPSN